MKKLRRGIIILVGVAIIIATLLFATLSYWLQRPFPQTDGVIELEGLTEPVHIYRDKDGVPHIYAENEADLFFAQGYTHAQDRFWQMEFWRHIGQGRLSEIIGEPGIETDKFIRNNGWNRIAAETDAYYQTEEPELYLLLEAYSAGVNAYLADHRDEDPSFNQAILNLSAGNWEIEDWAPLDTLSWATVMAWDLKGSANMLDEQRWLLIEEAVGPDLWRQLHPAYPSDRPIIVPDYPVADPTTLHKNQLSDSTTLLNQKMIGSIPSQGFAFGSGDAVGSNNWAVAGKHTSSGLPMLANDPHLGVQMPSIWYEMGLHAPGWDVVGFSFAGTPAIVVGHNNEISWGVTNLTGNTQDLFIEKINPENNLEYQFMGEWLPIEVVEERIKVNGSEDILLEVRITHHGPILNEPTEGVDLQLALQWNAATPSRLLKSVVLLNQAGNYEQFREALSYWDTAPQNFVYADRAGNIAYQATGRLPLTTNGISPFPVPGWDGAHEWDGWIPFEEMPALLNPEEGFIVTANNAIVPPNAVHPISLFWADGDRAARIRSMIETAIANDQPITAELFKEIQMDNRVLLADRYLPLLFALPQDDPLVAEAISHLEGWDTQADKESVAASVFELFYLHLAKATVEDELGPLAENYLGNGNIQRTFFHQLATKPNDPLWDDQRTAVVEGQEEMLIKALTEGMSWLKEHHGSDSANWAWGNLHTIKFVSNPLGQSGISLLEGLVNVGPFPADGNSSAVNASSWSWSNPAEVTHNASMRMIVDLADWNQFETLNASGQSGHPTHPNYSHQVPDWLDGVYHQRPFSRAIIEKDHFEHLILQP